MRENWLKRESVFLVDYRGLNEFATEVLGRNWGIIAQEEMSNDSAATFAIGAKMSSYEKEDVEKFISGKSNQLSAYLVLQYLAANGYIEAGTYVVEVSW